MMKYVELKGIIYVIDLRWNLSTDDNKLQLANEIQALR